MIAVPVAHSPQVPSGWARSLASRGFAAAGDEYRLGEISARAAAGWFVLETTALSRKAGKAQFELDRHGLWKLVGRKRDNRFVFEFPTAVLCPGAEAEEVDQTGSALPEALLDWALASAANELPPSWQPPPRELVASWMPQSALTVRVGPVVRQGELLLAQDRWALHFPILPCVPAALPEERRVALDLLAADAQDQQRMIRVGWAKQAEGMALVAAVDLTGAPHSELLFLTGLEGLTHAVAWLVETADFLADATVTFRALEVCRSQTKEAERKTA